MQDPLLQTLVEISTAAPGLETDITLVVGGFLVSGRIIDFESYCTHHPLTMKLLRMHEKSQQPPLSDEGDCTEATKAGVPDDPPNFIHLGDAKYFSPGGTPIPGNMGVYARIAVDAVQGFSFGRLTADPGPAKGKPRFLQP